MINRKSSKNERSKDILTDEEPKSKVQRIFHEY